VTAVIALLGLVLATLSLGWQAATFLLSGSRLKVNLIYSSRSEGQQLVEEILTIQIVNRGRATAYIDECVIYPADGHPGGGISASMEERTPPLPSHPLDGLKSTLMYADASLVRMLAESRPTADSPVKVFAQVTAGTGRQKNSKLLELSRPTAAIKPGSRADGCR
jgi:hypothetical protein